MKTIEHIATKLRDDDKKIHLLYAFNSVGKTTLSVEYKNVTKTDDGEHTGIYYNAYSEDLFVWDNDIENAEANIRLTVLPSSLNRLHADFSEINVRTKLERYRPNFDFLFNMHTDVEKGIESISFFPVGCEHGVGSAMKISRGEERIFVWSFFLAMMEVESWTENKTHHIFIDDPISSLDDHNIFVTVSTLYDLIEQHSDERKIIITTHHVGTFSMLCDWLMKGEKKEKYKKRTKASILSRKHSEVSLENHSNDVFLYHLRVLQLLKQALRDDLVRAYHLALLRQVLESVSSFLGVGRIRYVLEKIGFENAEEITRIMHARVHKDAYKSESVRLPPNELELFQEVLEKLNVQYSFKVHVN